MYINIKKYPKYGKKEDENKCPNKDDKISNMKKAQIPDGKSLSLNSLQVISFLHFIITSSFTMKFFVNIIKDF